MFKETTKDLHNKIQQLETELEDLKQSYKSKTSLVELLLKNYKKHSDNYLTVINPEFTLLEVNQQRLQQLGKNRSDLIGEKCYEVFYGYEEPCEECTVKNAIQTKETSRFLKLHDNDSDLSFEEKTVTPIVAESGAIDSLLIESKDITGYYQLIDSVDQRGELFKNVFESSGDAFLIHDENGKILEFGTRLPQLLGYTHSEMKELSIQDIDEPNNATNFYQRLQQFVDKDYLLFETDLVKKSGQIIAVEVSANIIPLQNQKIYFVSLRSLERRNKAEEQLRISEKRFRTLVENAPDLIMRFDKNFRHLFVNAATERILNISPDLFIGKTHQELGFPKDKCEFWEEELSKSFQDKKPRNVEFSIITNGEVKYFDWQLIPEFEQNGNVNTIMAIAREITSRKINEQALEKAVKTKDKFFSIIAHDLKNPFNVMIPLVDALRNNLESLSRDQLTEIINLLSASVKLEYNLLKNLLEWARSQTGAITQNPKSVDIGILVDNNLLLHKAKQESKQITIEVNNDTQSLAFVDEYMIDTVIRNLISNALKFTEVKGKVDIHIAEVNSHLQFSIEDNGIGISKKSQDKLFRIDTNYTRIGTNNESGTGLGLILCKEFIERNGGDISLKSEVGEGSKFTISLPKYQEQ